MLWIVNFAVCNTKYMFIRTPFKLACELAMFLYKCGVTRESVHFNGSPVKQLKHKQPVKVTVQFETEGNGQNEIVSDMDRSEVKLRFW